MFKKQIDLLDNLLKKYQIYAFKDVAIFMIILLIFHVLWKVFVTDFLSVGFILSSAQYLAEKVYQSSAWIVELFGVNVAAFDELKIDGQLHQNVFYYAGTNGYVYVNVSCSGLKQFYQWFFLMILYPGPWKNKLWFIPTGLVIIHIVNIMRILGMIAVTIYLPEKWHLMHDYVARPFFYVVMFFLWVWWNERYYLKAKVKST